MAKGKKVTVKSASVRVAQQRPKVAPRKMVGLRMSADELAFVDKAAKSLHRTRTQFVVLHALEAATRVLGAAAS